MMDYDPKVWLLFQQECKWWVSNVQQTQQQHKVNLLEQKKLRIEATIWHSSWPFIMTQEQAPFIKFTFPHISNQNCYSTLKSIFCLVSYDPLHALVLVLKQKLTPISVSIFAHKIQELYN